MGLDTVVDWLTWLGVVIPLIVLAWQAMRYVNIKQTAARQQEFNNFFRTVLRVHNSDRSQLSQEAAVFELRNFEDYIEFSLPLCENPEKYFPQEIPATLKQQFSQTASALKVCRWRRKLKRWF